MMLRYGFLTALAFAASVRAQPLLISEYIEGSGSNKAIEILNTTAAPYDLESNGVVLQIYNNGSVDPNSTFELSGILAVGDVFVAANSGADSAIIAQADFTSGNINFNGDDAVVLRYGGDEGPVIDVMGQIGFDPGAGWGTGEVSTVDHTLMRKDDACAGDTDPDNAFDPADDYDGFPQDTFSGIGSYSGNCHSAPQTTVRFAAASGEAEEGDGTLDLAVAISNPSETEATRVEVVFLPGLSSGSSTDIGGFTSAMVTFPAGSSDDQTVTITLTGDDEIEADETVVFELQGASGGQDATIGEPSRFTLTLHDDDVADFAFINEVDCDTPGADVEEFVELYDGGLGNTPLRGLVLVFFNGNGNSAYRTFDLDGAATDAGGFFLVGNEAVGPDRSFADGDLQDGPDAVALYVGDAADFPSGTTPATTAATLVDAVVYGTSDDRDDDLLQAFGADESGVANVVTVQFDERYEGASEQASLQRLNLPGEAARGGGAAASGLFYALAPTPRALDPAEITVDETTAVADVAGWRLLSSPLHTAYGDAEAGPTVADYAAINLVQGIPGEYPDADPNLYDAYLGDGAYGVPGGTDTELPPGQGFYWYWFDEDFGPSSGGTSQSYDLVNPDFRFALTGVPPDDALAAGPVAVPQTAHTDGFYLAGNPFPYPLLAGAVSTTSGTLHSPFGIWDPQALTYRTVVANFTDPYDPLGGAIPVWNGMFVEVEGASGTFDLRYSSAYVDPTSDASFVGRQVAATRARAAAISAPPEARVTLRLDGETDGGDQVADHAALLRFFDEGTPGWDRHDGSKLYPRTSAVALIAPVGERDGMPYRQSVLSLPYERPRRGTRIPLSLYANQPGTFTLSWELQDVPASWQLRLRDLDTGEEVDLRAAPSHTFSSGATTNWTDRFALSVAATRGEAETALALPDGYALSAAHPNPFETSTRFTLEVAEAQVVTVAVYDVLGRRVALLHDGPLDAGAAHAFTVDGRALASGTYVVRVEGETFVDVRRLTLLK